MDDGYIPINWIHLSSDRKKIIVNSSDDEAPSPVGLLLFTVEPLGGGTLNGLGNYDCNTMASPAQLEENVTGFFPGPLTLALPVNDLEWEGQISEVAQKGMNAILNTLSKLIQDEIEQKREVDPDYKKGFEFTIKNLGAAMINNHPDAINGVTITDGGNVALLNKEYDLYRVWIMLYRWVENEEGQWTWR